MGHGQQLCTYVGPGLSVQLPPAPGPWLSFGPSPHESWVVTSTPCLAALCLLHSLPFCLLWSSRGLSLEWHLTSRSSAYCPGRISPPPCLTPTGSPSPPLLSLLPISALILSILPQVAPCQAVGANTHPLPPVAPPHCQAHSRGRLPSVPLMTNTQIQSGSEAVDSKRSPAEPLKQK